MDALQRITGSARARREEQIEICEGLIRKLMNKHLPERSINGVDGYTEDGKDTVAIV